MYKQEYLTKENPAPIHIFQKVFFEAQQSILPHKAVKTQCSNIAKEKIKLL